MFRIWSGYPAEHRVMSISYKMFFIFQISYWLHQFPEFYLQKLKRDEIRQKTFHTVTYLAFITAAYFLNFTRVGMVLLSLDYLSQLIFHVTRLAHFLGKKNFSLPMFKVFNIAFVLLRFFSVVIAVMTFWYGLRQTEAPFIDISAGSFNTPAIRLNMLLAIVLVQLYLLYTFVSFHMGRFRESHAKKEKKKAAAAAAALPKKKKLSESVSFRLVELEIFNFSQIFQEADVKKKN